MNADVAKQRGWRWTLRRLSRGGPAEAVWRVGHMAAVERWNRSEVRAGADIALALSRLEAAAGTCGPLDDVAKVAAVERGHAVLSGSVTLLGVSRTDLQKPDWTSDAGASDAMGSDLDGTTPNPSLKHMWELSRLAPIVDLALAWTVSGDALFAHRAVDLLDQWCDAMRDRTSVLWGSGVEAALRIIALARTTQLLATNAEARQRISTHQHLPWVIDRHIDRLVRFPSRYSSANNHALVEAAGVLVGALIFAPADRSAKW